MKRANRLTSNLDFQRVRHSGKSFAHPLLILIAFRNTLPQSRVGISVSRAVGGAVKRNWAKRRIRAAVDEVVETLPGGWDLVFVARRSIVNAHYADIYTAAKSVLRRAGLLDELNGS